MRIYRVIHTVEQIDPTGIVAFAVAAVDRLVDLVVPWPVYRSDDFTFTDRDLGA